MWSNKVAKRFKGIALSWFLPLARNYRDCGRKEVQLKSPQMYLLIQVWLGNKMFVSFVNSFYDVVYILNNQHFLSPQFEVVP